MGSMCLPFPIAMNELRNGYPSIVPRIFTRPLVPKNLTESGLPGIGKSQISVDVAARISKGGRWPDSGNAPCGSVIILSAEDSADDTLRPRLEAAWPPLERAHALTAPLLAGRPR